MTAPNTVTAARTRGRPSLVSLLSGMFKAATLDTTITASPASAHRSAMPSIGQLGGAVHTNIAGAAVVVF